MTGRPQHFAFIDVETTGLHRSWSRIVEIGCVITDFGLRQVADPFHRVTLTQEVEWLEDEATQMHKDTGLYEESLKAKVDGYRATSLLLGYIWDKAPSGIVQVGFNADFDASFLAKHALNGAMSDFKRFNFKCIDVLALRRTVRSCIGEHALPPIHKPKHRAMDDIFHCMDEFGYYVNLLKDGWKNPSLLDKGFSI